MTFRFYWYLNFFTGSNSPVTGNFYITPFALAFCRHNFDHTFLKEIDKNIVYGNLKNSEHFLGGEGGIV